MVGDNGGGEDGGGGGGGDDDENLLATLQPLSCRGSERDLW